MKNFTFLLCLFLSPALFAQQDSTVSMSLLGNWDIDTLPDASGIVYNDVWGYVDCEGNEYGLIGTSERIYFLDISDPEAIVEKGHFDGGERTIWRDIKTYRDRAYAVSDDKSEGMMIFDLSNIQDTIIKTYQSTEFFNAAHNIFIEEQYGRMYIVGTNVEDIFVFDIATDPDNPILLFAGPLPGGDYVHDVYVRDNIAYCSHGYEGFFVWDMTDPTNPVYMASIPTGEYNHSSWLTDDGKYAYYAEEVPLGRPLGIINLEKKEEQLVELEKTFKDPILAPDFTENRPHNPFVRGDYLIASYYHDGIVIFDISDPLNPVRIAFYDTTPNTDYPDDYQGVWGAYPFLPSGRILGSDVTRGLLILSADSIDLKPADPVLYPDVTISTEAILPLCEGSQAVLTVPEGAELYEWYKNGEVAGDGIPSLIVDNEGMYMMKATNGHCTSQSELFEVNVNPLPDISSLATDSIQFCAGNSAMLEAPDSLDFYLWMKNGKVVSQQGNTFEVVDSGAYMLIAYKDGCASTSEPIRVDLHALPDIELAFSDTSFCEGDLVTLATLPGAASYEWTFDSLALSIDTNVISIEQSGAYAVKVSSSEGCEAQSEAISFVFNTPVIPEVSVADNKLRSSQAESYQWYLNNEAIAGATLQVYTIEESGFYHVETSDANACIAASELVDALFTGVSNHIIGSQLQLSPNPTAGVLWVQLELAKPLALEMILTDLNGRLIQQLQRPAEQIHQNRLDMGQLAPGLYLLHLNTTEGRMVRKVVKQ